MISEDSSERRFYDEYDSSYDNETSMSYDFNPYQSDFRNIERNFKYDKSIDASFVLNALYTS